MPRVATSSDFSTEANNLKFYVKSSGFSVLVPKLETLRKTVRSICNFWNIWLTNSICVSFHLRGNYPKVCQTSPLKDWPTCFVLCEQRHSHIMLPLMNLKNIMRKRQREKERESLVDLLELEKKGTKGN